MTNIFIDSSAFVALYLKHDDFHVQAISVLEKNKNARFLTTNFILDETYTFIRKAVGKKEALLLAQFLADNADFIKVKRITLEDERSAFLLFKKYDFSGLSFTDCTSFAVMNKLKVKEVFTFDRHFSQAGFKVLS